MAQLTARLRVLEERLQSTEDKEHGQFICVCRDFVAIVVVAVKHLPVFSPVHSS